MNNNLILSLLNSIIITFTYHIIHNNFINNIYQDKKKYNKQLLILFIISVVFTYLCFYINDNKMLNNILNNNLEIKEGDPNF